MAEGKGVSQINIVNLFPLSANRRGGEVNQSIHVALKILG